MATVANMVSMGTFLYSSLCQDEAVCKKTLWFTLLILIYYAQYFVLYEDVISYRCYYLKNKYLFLIFIYAELLADIYLFSTYNIFCSLYV